MPAEENPNWIATEAREAFFILGSFAIAESRRVMDMSEGIAGIPQKEGIAQRFELWLKTHEGEPGIGLLKRTYNYMLMEHAVDPDSLVHEWAESMAGNQYPMPGPYPEVYGNTCTRLSESGNV